MRRWFSAVGDKDAPSPQPEGTSQALRAAAQRLGAVVATARQAAEEIGAEANRCLAEPGVANVISEERVAAELFESLAARADALRSEAEELSRLLARAADHLTAPAGPAPAPDRPPEPRPEVEQPRATPSPAFVGRTAPAANGGEPTQRRRRSSEGVRLLATSDGRRRERSR